MTKKIIASAVLAAALFAGTSVSAAHAAPVAAASTSASAAKVVVTKAQKAQVADAVSAAVDNGFGAILVTGFKKPSAASKALAAYATAYVAKKGADLEVRVAATLAKKLVVVAADETTDGIIMINNHIVNDGAVFHVAAGTTSVVIDSQFETDYVTISVDGATGLVAGDNIVSVTATAADGTENIFSYDVVVG
jgi:hypothetical protein